MIRVPTAELTDWMDRLETVEPVRRYGRVKEVVGLVMRSSGPLASLGEVCEVLPEGPSSRAPGLFAEVVGFSGSDVLLMPLEETAGLRAGCYVRSTGRCHEVPTGEPLLGRVLDGLGHPLDGRPLPPGLQMVPVHRDPPHALERKRISLPLSLGVRCIDGLMTCGIGQRVGIFAGSGVGKSTLLGMVARNSSADVNVIGLVGERGREVREFIENDLGLEGLSRSVVVVATSDQPALLRIKAAFTATAIAEGFRDQGKSVLLMMDSVTRFAMAQREVGLAVGEPPSTRGYTPSVFGLLPKLMERAGNAGRGSITALYTVLVEGDDTNEPIADTARSILDGHIVLDRSLASKGHYPAIDPLHSLSRVMNMVVSEEHVRAAARVKELVAAYRDVEDMVTIGAYQKGSKPLADEAIEKWDRIQAFLRQDRNETVDFRTTVDQLMELAHA
ncbi:MAG: EscN/YscN/HrcN family type III secretion system ATPase [Fimbriimonadales bacterium]|nr:MAG: EscN/YscN/HrcN family type III secretion system ATPase [Fimbriimonadales bacterium]